MTADDPAVAFPAITLQPVTNARHAWVALVLEASPPPDTATLGRLFGEFGLYDALQGLSCVIVVDAPADDLADDLPASETILRLPPALCADPAAAGLLARLRHDGFRLLVDGLPPAGAVLPPGVTGVTLDCGAPPLPPGSAEWLRRLPGMHLARGVDSPALLAFCRGGGFHWFAGNYPRHPAATPAGAPSGGLLLKLLDLVVRDADSREIESLLKQDPHLSYQLLRLVNSAAYALPQPIGSFGQALQLLGRRQLQRWLQLLLYAAPAGGGASPLLPRAALRAGLMEALLRDAGGSGERLDHAFMVGMFSLLDSLLGKPLAEVVKPLRLAAEIDAALIDGTGELARLLTAVVAGETSPAALAAALPVAGIAPAAWARALVRAGRWAIQVSRENG